MPQSLSNLDAALKDDYGPGLRESVNNSNPVWTEATRNDEDIQGRQAVWAVHTARSTSTGARAELSTLPSADRERYSQAKQTLAFLYHTIKVSGPSIALTRGDDGAFVRALEAEIDGAEKNLKVDCARQAFGDVVTVNSIVQTGVLATVTSDTGTVTTLGSPTEDETAISAAEMRYFFVGMSVDYLSGTTGALRGTVVLTAVDRVNGTITSAASPAGTTDEDVISRQGSFGAEMLGLRALVKDTGTIANISPTTVPTWAAIKVGSSTTAISEVLFDQATEGVETDGDGSTPNLYFCEHAQRRKLASILQAQKRYDGKQVTLQAGWNGLQLARGVLIADRFCPTNTAFAITPKELVRFVGQDFQWDDRDGKILKPAFDGSDAVEARYLAYQQLMTTNRNSHTLISMATPTF